MTPSGWQRKKIGDFLTESRIHGSNGRLARKITVKLYGKGVLEKREKLAGSENTPYYIRRAGQLIYSKLDFLNGAFGVIPIELDGFETTLDLPCFDISDELDPKWLTAILTRPSFYSSFQGDAKGSRKARRINQSDFLDIELQVPPMGEQKKISAILGSVDDAINTTQAVIDQTRTVKQGLFQELLTRGIGHTRFKHTEIGEIPESWSVFTAASICHKITVGIVVNPSHYYESEGIKCFRSANVRDGYIENSNWVFISESSNELHIKSKLKTGDVLIVRTGHPGTSCVVTEEYNGTNCIDIILARPDKSIVLPDYLSSFVNSPSGKKQVLSGQGGLAQKHFNVGALAKMHVAVPPLDEQRIIVNKIQSIEYSITCHEKVLASLGNLKLGILDDLLSGRTRVEIPA